MISRAVNEVHCSDVVGNFVKLKVAVTSCKRVCALAQKKNGKFLQLWVELIPCICICAQMNSNFLNLSVCFPINVMHQSIKTSSLTNKKPTLTGKLSSRISNK